MAGTAKALGTAALMAVMASALLAALAQAEGTKGVLTAGEASPPVHEDATLVGEQYGTADANFLEAPEGEGLRVSCHSAIFTGTLAEGGTSSKQGVSGTELTTTPHYEECYASSNTPATVDMNECDFVLAQPETAEGVPEGSYTGKVDLTCPLHEKIVIRVFLFGSSTEGTHSFPVCTVEVFPNAEETVAGHTTEELGGHVVYTPAGGGKGQNYFTAEAAIDGVSFKDNCNSTEGENAIYRSTLEVKAFDDSEHTEQLDGWIGSDGFAAGETGGEPVHVDATVDGLQYGEEEAWNFFEVGGEKLRCDAVAFAGTLDEGGTGEGQGVSGKELTLEPQYEECYAQGSSPSTVDMNGCDYVFAQPTTAEDVEGGQYTAKASLTCPEGEAIVITVYLFGNSTEGTHSFPVCTIEVFANGETKGGHDTDQLGGHVVYTPIDGEATEDDLAAKVDVSEIAYKDGCQEEEGEDAVYKQTATLEAFNDPVEGPHTEQRDLWISEES